MRRAALLVAVAALLAGACDGNGAATPTSETPSTDVSSTLATTTAAEKDPPDDATDDTTADASDDAATSPATTSATTSATAGGPPATSPDGAEALGPLGETDLDIETDGGSVQIGSGTVPPAAADVPVPADLDVQLASESDGSAGFSGTSAESVEELAAFYRAQLPAAGFEITEDTEAGTSVFIVFARPGEVGQVAISDDPTGNGSTVLVAFGPA